MAKPFESYEAYLDRYKTFYSEEGDHRPPIMSEEEFQENFRALRHSYIAYQDMLKMGHMDQAQIYYQSLINDLENQLAIADASDNFGQFIL